ncbi:MAG: glycosyltransferase family 2 protein [Rikenellaceae bacterium]
MSQNPEISFVVVNYNGIKHTRELLVSIEEHLSEISHEVIVVDNGSVNNESLPLAKEFPKAIVIRSKSNLGFSGGNNLGIKTSSGRYVMLINNDTLIRDNSVSELVKMLDSDPFIGAVSPKIHFMNPPDTIQFAGFTELTRITLRNRAIGYNEPDRGQYDTPAETASTHGAAMMVRREVIERIGYMPEIYFLYYEELDWCAKMRECGYRLMYQPATLIIHKESQSTGSDSYLKRYYMTRNRLLFAHRNRRGFVRFLAIAYQLLVADPKLLLLSIFKGRRNLVLATLNGVIDYFKLNTESV